MLKIFTFTSFTATTHTHAAAKNEQVSQFSYRLRNVKFERALVLKDHAIDYEFLTTLNPGQEKEGGWHEFRILSLSEGDRKVHCRGFIRISQQAGQGIYARQRYLFKLTRLQ